MRIIFLDLGNGWGPAILKSTGEQELVKGVQVGNGELDSYWIDGSTDAPVLPGETIYYSDYITTESGNHIIYKVIIFFGLHIPFKYYL